MTETGIGEAKSSRKRMGVKMATGVRETRQFRSRDASRFRSKRPCAALTKLLDPSLVCFLLTDEVQERCERYPNLERWET